VVIDLDDEAKIKNSAVRSRKARSGADVAFNVDMFSVLEDGNAEFDAGSIDAGRRHGVGQTGADLGELRVIHCSKRVAAAKDNTEEH
jgi:hypothetical protein